MGKQVIIKDFEIAIVAFLIAGGLSIITDFPIEAALGIPCGIMLASFLYELAR